MMDDTGEVQQGEGGEEMPMQRIEEVEKQLMALSNEFTRMAGENITAETKRLLLEETLNRHESDIRQLKETTNKIELLFNRITQQLDNQDMKLFQLLQQSQKEGSSERTAMAKERTAILREFLKFSTYIIGGTIIFIVAKLFIAP